MLEGPELSLVFGRRIGFKRCLNAPERMLVSGPNTREGSGKVFTKNFQVSPPPPPPVRNVQMAVSGAQNGPQK